MIHHGDCLEVLPTLPADSIDSIVTDPPYGLSFMGKNWDHGIPGVAFWSEALRVAKPGSHLLAFGGTRTFHRLTCAIEDAGWEIRDCIMWVYGSGFPKSHDVSKAIDKAAGAERKVVGPKVYPDGQTYNGGSRAGRTGGGIMSVITERGPSFATSPATPAAQQWQGWGTALKPAWEPIIVARRPLAGTVAANVQAFGTGAVNVDGCRVAADKGRPLIESRNDGSLNAYGDGLNGSRNAGVTTQGRWPANLIHDGSDEVAGLFPETGPSQSANRGRGYGNGVFANDCEYDGTVRGHDDNGGSVARFFYCAKASKADRDEGVAGVAGVAGVGALRDGGRVSLPRRNHHPTVKPTALMRYLCRLVTPPGGTVLDPFCGSGSTGKAATLEGFEFIGIEREAEYAEIARARIAHARGDMPLLEAVQ